MRITRVERGSISGQNYDGRYTDVFTQPVHYVVLWWLYHHIWEKLTWRFYRWLWKVLPHKPDWVEFSDGKQYDVAMPFANRQDERCFDLDHAGRIKVSWIEDPPRPKVIGWQCQHVKLTGHGIVGRPSWTVCDCDPEPIHA